MKNKNLILIISGVVIIMFMAVFFIFKYQKPKVSIEENKVKPVISKKFKILHIMSYHMPWEWTEDQLNGFKAGLQGLNVEFKIIQMDLKRNNSKEWINKISADAKKQINDWKPDLVFTTDDAVQEYVVKDFINKNINFVFAGVNAEPETYGFDKSKNITGVLEQEHFVQTVKLLKEIKPTIKRIAVIFDEDPTWNGVIKRMKEKAPKELKDINFISWDKINTFEEYKEKIKQYQKSADALALLGIHTFKDEKGANVPWQDVLKWTAENSNLPDFSFWKDRVQYGTLCVVYVSGYEQGLSAGKKAYKILAEGVSPSDIPMEPTVKGKPIISLARAKKLGINVRSTILLSSEVVEKFEWQK